MDQPLIPSHLGPPQPKMLSHHQEAMVEACKAGRLAELQKLFNEHDVKRGGDPVRYLDATREGAPETRKLFASAISRGHQSIVRYLHLMYPKFNFYDATIVLALLERPDLEMLNLIYSYSPQVVRFEFDDHTQSLLSNACRGGPDNAPFIDFLLDHGATAGGYTFHFGEALLPAIQYDQPIEIIKKMAPKTPRLGLPIFAAVKRKRADTLELLLNEEQTRSQTPSSLLLARSLLGNAQATEDKRVIALVERYIHNKEQQATKSITRDLQSTRNESDQATKPNEAGEAGAEQCKSSDMKPEESRRWWQFRTRAEAEEDANAEDSGSSAIRTGAPKWWWPLSNIGNKPKSADRHHHKKESCDSTSDEDTLKHC